MDFDEKMCQGITHIWLQQQVDVKYVWLVPGDMVHSCCPSKNVKRWTITEMPELSTNWKLTDKSSRRADCKTARLFLSVECERKKNVCPSCHWVTTFHLLLSFRPHLTDQEKRKTVHTSSLQEEEEEEVLTMKSNTLKPIFSNTRHMCPWWLNQSSSTTHRLQQKNVKINYYIQNLTDLTHRLEQ